MTSKVLILTSYLGTEAELAALVRDAGGWIAATARVGDAADAIAAAGAIDAIVADWRGGATFEALGTIDIPLVIEIDVEAIDAAAALLDRSHIQILVDPDPIERAAAIAVALGGSEAAVRERTLPGLRELSEEAGRIARALADLAATAVPVHPAPDASANLAPVAPSSAQAVRSILRKRRLRERFFAAEIFADPAWDILLDLYAARLEGAQVSVSSLCIAACVPPTTALRWIRSLTAQGLLMRAADAGDRRRIHVTLSDGAADRMAAYLATAAT